MHMPCFEISRNRLRLIEISCTTNFNEFLFISTRVQIMIEKA